MTRTGLTRQSVGLNDAHKELIRLLAERAVADYLREVEADDEDREEPRENLAPRRGEAVGR